MDATSMQWHPRKQKAKHTFGYTVAPPLKDCLLIDHVSHKSFLCMNVQYTSFERPIFI